MRLPQVPPGAPLLPLPQNQMEEGGSYLCNDRTDIPRRRGLFTTLIEAESLLAQVLVSGNSDDGIQSQFNIAHSQNWSISSCILFVLGQIEDGFTPGAEYELFCRSLCRVFRQG